MKSAMFLLIVLLLGCARNPDFEERVQAQKEEKVFLEAYPKGFLVVHKLTGDTLMITGRYVRSGSLRVKDRDLDLLEVDTFEVSPAFKREQTTYEEEQP